MNENPTRIAVFIFRQLWTNVTYVRMLWLEFSSFHKYSLQMAQYIIKYNFTLYHDCLIFLDLPFRFILLLINWQMTQLCGDPNIYPAWLLTHACTHIPPTHTPFLPPRFLVMAFFLAFEYSQCSLKAQQTDFPLIQDKLMLRDPLEHSTVVPTFSLTGIED